MPTKEGNNASEEYVHPLNANIDREASDNLIAIFFI